MDGSGWSISWLLGIFHKPTLNPIASPLARVSALLINGLAGHTLEFILGLGVLSPINKQAQELQNSDVLAGKDLKLRLVCQFKVLSAVRLLPNATLTQNQPRI